MPGKKYIVVPDDGHEYDWALVGDDKVERYKDIQKPEIKCQDVSIFSLCVSKNGLLIIREGV